MAEVKNVVLAPITSVGGSKLKVDVSYKLVFSPSEAGKQFKVVISLFGEDKSGDDEPAGIVRDRHHSQKSCHQRYGSQPRGKRCPGNGGGRNQRSEKKSTAPAERSELRRKPKPALFMADADARNQWEPDTDLVVAVLDHHVVEMLELGSKREERRIQRIPQPRKDSRERRRELCRSLSSAFSLI